MGKYIDKISKIWRLIRIPFLVIFSVAIIILFGIYIFSITRVAGDAASHLLLAISPILKIGSPYKDIWEIKPPVWPLVIYVWSNLFGFSILSLKIANIIIAGCVMLVSGKIYKKIFQTPVFEIIFIFTTVVVLSPIFSEFIIPTEILGLLFSISALLILLTVKKDFQRFFFSGFLFFIASQTKEPFTFTILAVLPIFFESLLNGGFSKLFKNIIQFSLGIFSGFAILYIYLAGMGSVDSYLEVFKYKQTYFSFTLEKLSLNFLPGFYAAERTFTEFSRGFSVLGALLIISFYFVNKFKKTLNYDSHKSQLVMKQIIISDSGKFAKCSALFYALGSFLGFGLGGSLGSHYLIQVVVPFYLLGGLVVSYLFKNVTSSFNKSRTIFFVVLTVFLFSVIVIMPKRQYLSSYLPGSINFVIPDKITGFEKRVEELTTKNQCVLSVYGWGVSENYLYSKRRPCTRFFLPNIVREDWQKKEYAEDIIENPPALIIYRTVDTDMDVNKFESEVINIGRIVKNCYTKDSKEEVVYTPKTKDIEQLKNCIKISGI